MEPELLLMRLRMPIFGSIEWSAEAFLETSFVRISAGYELPFWEAEVCLTK